MYRASQQHSRQGLRTAGETLLLSACNKEGQVSWRSKSAKPQQSGRVHS